MQNHCPKDKSISQRWTGEESCTNAGNTVSLNAEKTCTFLTTQASLMDTGSSREQRKTYVVNYRMCNILPIFALLVMKVVTKEP